MKRFLPHMVACGELSTEHIALRLPRSLPPPLERGPNRSPAWVETNDIVIMEESISHDILNVTDRFVKNIIYQYLMTD